MNENLTWAWLAAGLVPYHIDKKLPSRRERIVTIRAMFWTLELRTRWLRPTHRDRRSRRCTDWTLRIPLIERVRDAVWVAVMRLRGAESEEPQP
jgi:hypothetical protein